MRIVSFLVYCLVAVFAVVDPALAEGAAQSPIFGELGNLGAGLGLGIAALGGALGQGKVAASALDSISRNPGASGSMFLPMILGLVFIETLVLFTFVVTSGLAGTQ